ncbi:MAG TPA: hypothetical protein VHT34_08460, partial [Clostridia bacterium]|nr:hypothetical protein [Clostridia bacterium]
RGISGGEFIYESSPHFSIIFINLRIAPLKFLASDVFLSILSAKKYFAKKRPKALPLISILTSR